MSLCKNGIGNAYSRVQLGQSPEDYNGPQGGYYYPETLPYYVDEAYIDEMSGDVYMIPPGTNPQTLTYSPGPPAGCPDGYIADGYGGCFPYAQYGFPVNYGYGSQAGYGPGFVQLQYPSAPSCPACPSCPPANNYAVRPAYAAPPRRR